ncbi:MAG: hypothetical protein NTZ55_04965 [Candidatus Roizmanbacteria bacterium]|nr:hypothetical protein [Candidatus Roizmanbacteria bacterium]
MPEKKQIDKLRKQGGIFLQLALAIFCLYILYSHWVLFAVSNFEVNEFAGALRMLPHFYYKLGLTPYNQFGIVYPPGLFLIVGKLIPFASIFQRNLIFSIIELIFVGLNCFLISKLAKTKAQKITIVSLFLLISVIIIGNVWSDPFSYQLLTTLILLNLLFLSSNKQSLRIPIASAFLADLSVFFRWDLITIYAGMTSALYLAYILYTTIFKKRNIQDRIGFWRVIFFELMGLGVGFLCLAGYLYSIHALRTGIDFIFRIPTLVILPYRKLPLPPFVSIFNNAYSIYSCLLIIAVNAIRYIRNKLFGSGSFIKLFLLCFPLVLLPYALGRTNLGHVLPLLYLVALSLLIEYSMFPKNPVPVILMFILLIPIWNFFIPGRSILPKTKNYLSKTVNTLVSDCKSKMPQSSLYNSLFVGRLSYQQFISNSAVLYLLNPDKPPATAYISDEPGLQNSCYYGSLIAKQLENSPKPMLSFLEVSPQEPEHNLTRYMQSCNKIEDFLKNGKFKTIGKCTVNTKQFEIRIYQ